MAGLPDWYKSVRLSGKYGTQLIPVAVDENGNLYAVIKGTDGTQLRTVKLDVDGSILAKLVGGTIDVGTVNTVNDKDRNVQGYDGVSYKPIAVDADGIMLARLKGFDGSQLRDVLVDDAGRIVGVFKGRYTNPLDIVLDLPFDEGSGSTVYDQSLYGNNGTIYGATWTKGRFGYGLNFDGVDDYVEVPDSASLHFGGSDSFTITGWFKLDVLPSEKGVSEAIVSKTQDFLVRVDEIDDKLYFRVWDGADYLPKTSAAYALSANQWYFFAAVYSAGGELKMYLNGELYGTATNTKADPTTNPVHIGRFYSNFLDGTIDEVRIYKRALTDEEIKELYEGRPTLRVDRSGNLASVLYGKVGNIYKPIEIDSLSNLKINISAQELETLLQAPRYGGSKYVEFSGTLDPGYDATPVSISGAGVIYGGFIKISGVQTPDRFGIGVNIDGLGFPQKMLATYHDSYVNDANAYHYYEVVYDTVNYIYAYHFSPGKTFESSWKLSLASLPTAVGTASYYGIIIYALRLG